MDGTRQASTGRSARLEYPVIGIGASAGGLEAVRDMFAAAPAKTGLAFVLVQHLDPTHESMMAELIGKHTDLEVRQLEDGDTPEPDCVSIIPPGFALRLREGVLRLSEFTEPRGLRRPIDEFLQSVAEDQGESTACVILSGTGADGATGLRAIKEHGGVVIAQDPHTAKYDGMPSAAVATGLVDFTRKPSEIVPQLITFFDNRRNGMAGLEDREVAGNIDELCASLRDAVGHDFAGYKRSTLIRRIDRRMQVLGLSEAEQYLERIRHDAEECEALFRDLLINVTGFFRDADMFRTLRECAVEPIVQSASANDDIRVWVPGCSSGEEAYSIAMLFCEAARRRKTRLSVHIFATDIDEQMLSVAREGKYPIGALRDLPEELRDRYTTGYDGYFQIIPQLRDMVRFSNHSVIKDPPFSRLDLVSCRNLLIYLGDRLQSSFIPLMHYALKPGGFLFLGPSESIGRRDDLFSAIEHKARLYRRREGRVSYPMELPAARAGQRAQARNETRRSMGDDEEFFGGEVVTAALLNRYAPPHVIVDRNGEIQAHRGSLAKYLEMPSANTTTHISAIARPGLKEVLPGLIRQASESSSRRAHRGVSVRSEFGTQEMDVVVDPMPDGHILVVFIDRGRFEQELRDDYVDDLPEDDRASELEEELRVTRFRLRSTVEELETANEELKSSNEEMMSMNEELQSANEELATINEELKNKVDELGVANADLTNVLDSGGIGFLVVDSRLRVRMFTEEVRDILPVSDSDEGRPVSDLRAEVTDLIVRGAQAVAEEDGFEEQTVFSLDGQRCYVMRILPYLDKEGERQGATITFTDITRKLVLENDLIDQGRRLRMALSAAQMGVFEVDEKTGQVLFDSSVGEMLGLDQSGPMTIADFLARLDESDRDEVGEAIRSAIERDEPFSAEFRIASAEEPSWIKGVGQRVGNDRPDEAPRLIGLFYDVTAEFSARETNHLLLREMHHRVKNLFAVVSAMFALAGRSETDVASLVKGMRSRILALSRAHQVADGEDQAGGISFDALIRTILAPHGEEAAIDVRGPDVALPPNLVTPVSLILHEWSTNAAKYGALSRAGGKLECIWDIQPLDGNRKQIVLSWNETGQSHVSDPKSEPGFGSQLVEMSVKQLGAELEREWERDGLHATIRFEFDGD